MKDHNGTRVDMRWIDRDPDCAECDKPDQWESLHSVVATLRAELDFAHRNYTLACAELKAAQTEIADLRVRLSKS